MNNLEDMKDLIKKLEDNKKENILLSNRLNMEIMDITNKKDPEIIELILLGIKIIKENKDNTNIWITFNTVFVKQAISSNLDDDYISNIKGVHKRKVIKYEFIKGLISFETHPELYKKTLNAKLLNAKEIKKLNIPVNKTETEKIVLRLADLKGGK